MLNAEMIEKLSRYFATQPVERAWLFGSYARGEETPDSDVDILVSWRRDSKVSLLKHIHIRNGIKDMLNRNVDLVEDGTLLPYAVRSVNKDKILIYERAD